MPSAAKTKSGRIFRAPTDQARKQERRRENKKNKKDRIQIRQTIAKCCNVDECVEKMLGLERQIQGLDGQQFHVDVLKKKQKTLMEMVDRRRMVLTKTKDDEGLKGLNEKLQHYYQDASRLKQLAVQERLARLADPSSIPLPEGVPDVIGDARRVQLMGPQASASAPKKVDFRLPRGGRGKGVPPGPPCGKPPVLSDSEGEEDFENPDDDDLAPVPIPDFDAPVEPRYPRYAPSMPLRSAPGPPPMPPPPMFNPMGLPMSARPPHPEAAIISSAPVIRREPMTMGPTPEAAPTVVSAAPQLRDLRRETVKLVPVQLQRHTRPAQLSQSRPRPAAPRKPTEQHTAAKTTDDAYNDFMKELGDLI